MLLKKKQLGQLGENIAAYYYQKLGYKIIIRNFVLIKNNKILVVEVKTRRNTKFGYGEETISDKKLNNIYISYQILRKQKNLSTFFEIEVCVLYLCYNRYTVKRFII